MRDLKKVKTALISVYYKDGLEDIIKILNSNNVRIISTGGTQKFIEGLGVKVEAVEKITDYPSILGGRVKTLHPKVFGGILSRRNNESDIKDLENYTISEIDLVIVDLYPFEETLKSGATESELIEKIDIGGISLIRAAAKNFNDVLIVSNVSQYKEVCSILKENCSTNIDVRRKFAKEAFRTSSSYDNLIFNYFADNKDLDIKVNGSEKTLRYGENPHQIASFIGDFDAAFEQINGKEVSYNNLLDIDAAINLINDFNQTTFAVIKHNNACGLASDENHLSCWKKALEADPISAFGGVLVTNKKISLDVADEINKLFFEILIAPDFDNDALNILSSKKNRIILKNKGIICSEKQYRTSLNGVLVQNRDLKIVTENELNFVTENRPSKEEIQDLLFANIIVKHTKSNAIVLVKNNQLLASGIGQTSRVDALKQAIEKAKSFNFNLNGAVMASDAFFPFADSVEIAHNNGISAVIQPGGSVRDNETIDFCNKHNIKMVFTGFRHFKH